jgi:hypothetical protein
MRYFVLDRGPARGPYDLEQIRQRLSVGKITREAMACAEGDSRWQPLGPILDAADDEEDARALFKPSPLADQGLLEDDATPMLERVDPPPPVRASASGVEDAAALAQAVSDARKRIESGSATGTPPRATNPDPGASGSAGTWKVPPIPPSVLAAAASRSPSPPKAAVFRRATCPKCKREVPVPAEVEAARCSYCGATIGPPAAAGPGAFRALRRFAVEHPVAASGIGIGTVLVLVATGLLSAAIASGGRGSTELHPAIDQRLANRRAAPQPRASASPPTQADEVAVSQEFLAKLDALMADYKKDARGPAYALDFHIDSDWATRKTASSPAVFGCWNSDRRDTRYGWAPLQRTKEECDSFSYINAGVYIWKVKVPAREAVYLYSNSDKPPTEPPELMRRMNAAKLKAPARFSCRAEAVAKTTGGHVITCLGSTASVIRASSPLPHVNIGDVVSAPLADAKRDPDGVLSKDFGSKAPVWTIDADGATVSVDVAITRPAADATPAASASAPNPSPSVPASASAPSRPPLPPKPACRWCAFNAMCAFLVDGTADPSLPCCRPIPNPGDGPEP